MMLGGELKCWLCDRSLDSRFEQDKVACHHPTQRGGVRLLPLLWLLVPLTG